MKKYIIFISAIIIFTLLSILYLNSSYYKLHKLGYTFNEISNINKLNNELFYKKYYDIDLLINNNDFINENLERYLKYIDKYDIEYENAILMVNYNLDEYEFNQNIIDLKNDENFQIDKLESYLNYLKKYDIDYSKAILMVNNNLDEYEYSKTLIDIKNDKFFKKDNLKRYIDFYLQNKDFDARKIVSYVNCNLDYKYYTNMKPSNLDDDNSIIVNKYYYLSSTYKPSDLVVVQGIYSCGYGTDYLRKEAYEAFKKMADDARKEGLNIYISSAFRDYEEQDIIYNRYLLKDPKEIVDTYSARPGNSEHQTGLAIDVNIIDDSFKNTKEYKWLKDNSYKYGFNLRYTEDNVKLTGYKFEPWHYRYLGVEIATYLYENNITYDEYYEYFIKK